MINFDDVTGENIKKNITQKKLLIIDQISNHWQLWIRKNKCLT